MSSLLKAALAERKELTQRLEKLEKVILLLGGETEKPKRRHHNAATRKKMKDAWTRRKAKSAEDIIKRGQESGIFKKENDGD